MQHLHQVYEHHAGLGLGILKPVAPVGAQDVVHLLVLDNRQVLKLGLERALKEWRRVLAALVTVRVGVDQHVRLFGQGVHFARRLVNVGAVDQVRARVRNQAAMVVGALRHVAIGLAGPGVVVALIPYDLFGRRGRVVLE